MADCKDFLKSLMLTRLELNKRDRDTQFTQTIVISIWYFTIGCIVYALLGLLQPTEHGTVYTLTWCIGYFCFAFILWYIVVNGFGCKGHMLHDSACLAIGCLTVWWGIKVILKGMADYQIDHSTVKEAFFFASGLVWILVGATATLPMASKSEDVEAVSQAESSSSLKQFGQQLYTVTRQLFGLFCPGQNGSKDVDQESHPAADYLLVVD